MVQETNQGTRIIYRRPLLWFVVKIFFPKAKWGEIAFTFGNTIYSPREMRDDLIIHELVHMKQQRGSRLLGCVWFMKYVISKKFRVRIEIEAYRAQYLFIKRTTKDKNKLNLIGRNLARFCSSSTYGNMISYTEAFNLIT